jgi:ATP-dependent DNA helicase RecG
VFHRRGIIESWGRGTIKMAELAEKAGLPRPEIEEAAGCVVVRFRPSQYIAPQRVMKDLTPRQRKILQFLAGQRWGVARSDIVAFVGGSALAIRDDLEKLRSFDLVVTYGHGRGAVWRLKNP